MKELIFVLTIFFISSCSIFEPKPESEKFYCKIDGKAWRPEKASFTSKPPITAEWFKNGNFGISAYNVNQNIIIGIKLGVNIPLEVKTYELQNQTSGNIGNYYDTSILPREQLTSKSGNIKITKIDANSVSGTFEFKTYSDIKKRECNITRGQFNNLLFTKY